MLDSSGDNITPHHHHHRSFCSFSTILYLFLLLLFFLRAQVSKLSPPVLEVMDVDFKYATGPTILKDVNFGLDQTSRVCIVGPNGAGETDKKHVKNKKACLFVTVQHEKITKYNLVVEGARLRYVALFCLCQKYVSLSLNACCGSHAMPCHVMIMIMTPLRVCKACYPL